MKYFKLLFLFLVLFIGLLKGFAYNSTYRVKVGETFTVHTTYKSNTISITWTYDHKSVVPSGYVGAASTSVTFEAIAPTLSSGSVIQSITYYRQDGYTKKQVDDWLVIVSPIQVSSISVSPSSKSLYEGQHVDLTATISPSNATNKEVKWTSEDSRVATVNSNGRVTAVKAGTTIIKCTAEDGSKKSGECRITVEEPILVTEINLYPTNLTLNVGEYNALACTVSPSNATNRSLTWTSNRVDVATVNSYGIVQGVGAGNAIITCTANDGSGVSATCSVTVKPIDPTSISLPSEMTIGIGETAKIPVTFEPNNASSSISWTSDNQSIVTVASTGEVKGVKEGTATITATTANGKTASCKVIVDKDKEVPVNITLEYCNLEVGYSTKMRYKLEPENVNTTITWTSSDTSIATVSSDGIVKGITAGSTWITATTADGLSSRAKVVVGGFQNYTLFHGTTSDDSDITYIVTDINAKTCRVLSCEKRAKEIEIPSTVMGYRVTSIRDNAFYNCEIESITLPNSITSIGDHAFWNCRSLTNVSGFDNVEYIGGGAFSSTPWFENLSDGVKYIGKALYAYKGKMPANTTINVKEGCKQIAGYAFSMQDGLVAITIPSSIVTIDGTPLLSTKIR